MWFMKMKTDFEVPLYETGVVSVEGLLMVLLFHRNRVERFPRQGKKGAPYRYLILPHPAFFSSSTLHFHKLTTLP